MDAVLIGNTNLRECPRCEGIWAAIDSLDQLCADREKQSAILGLATHLPSGQSVDLETHIRYIPCPICHEFMNRVNFARCSNVIVDVCKPHGTWFDRDELRRIVEFIRGGGLETARSREIAELAQRKRELNSAQVAGGLDRAFSGSDAKNYDGWELGISAVATVLKALLR
jgi:Zn-finger nucleic acid-binding protein